MNNPECHNGVSIRRVWPELPAHVGMINTGWLDEFLRN